jgi:hypothetical protein
VIDRGKPDFKAIEKDKKSDRQYFCVGCGGVATKTAHFKTPGATILERYCDACASKLD